MSGSPKVAAEDSLRRLVDIEPKDVGADALARTRSEQAKQTVAKAGEIRIGARDHVFNPLRRCKCDASVSQF